MAAEWTYLFENFPQAIPFFSAWMDIRDIAKDLTSSVGVIPGLTSLLQIFGYHWKDLQPSRKIPLAAMPTMLEMMLSQLALWLRLFLRQIIRKS